MLFSSHGVWRLFQDGVMNGRRTGSAVGEKNVLDGEQGVNGVNDVGRDYLQV